MMTKPHFLWAALILLTLIFIWPNPPLPAQTPEQPSLLDRIQRSYADIVHSREALAGIISFMESRPDLFPKTSAKARPMLSREERMTVWHTWQRFLDHMVALAFLEQQYAALQEKEIEIAEKELFLGRYAIFLSQYRYALAFIQIAEEDPNLNTLLNDPVPEIGLPENTYSRLKSEFLNVVKGTRFARLDLEYQYGGLSPPEPIARGIEADRAFIWEMGKGTGPLLTLKNGLRIVQDTGYRAWFPVQKNVAQWMGDTKVWREHQSLITEAQIRALRSLLAPGDILLSRREWYLSNIGLPGFWPHSALYVGTPQERKAYFGADVGVRVWVRMHGVESGNFEDFLQKSYPDAFLKNGPSGSQSRAPTVVEATSEGVCLVPLETAAHADTLAVLRPRLPRVAQARAVLRAFLYRGRPYDFDFDFQTDSSLVCTELIYKAYEPEPHIAGLALPLQEILGRQVTTANHMVRMFDEEYGKKTQQLDLILFLDANETHKAAYRSRVKAFRGSWKRPKWHILVAENTPPQK